MNYGSENILIEEMELICDSEVKVEEWKEFIANSKLASPFQTPEFYNLYNSISGQSAKVFAIREKGILSALCVVTIQKEAGLKGYFSRRGIIYGGILIADKDSDALSRLLIGIKKELSRKVIYIESRNFFSYKDYVEEFKNQGWNYRPYLNYEIDLRQKTMDSLLAGMKYNRKREINQSVQSGAIFKVANSENEVKELYDILADLYETRVKLPLPTLTYFIKFFHSDIGKIFVVKHSDKIIGGSFCYYLKGGSIYTIYYCGLRDYDKKIFPTHLSIVAALDFGISESLTALDLMGAGEPDKKYGVRSYKSEFGGAQVEYGRFIRINNAFLYNLGKLGLSVLSKFKRKKECAF